MDIKKALAERYANALIYPLQVDRICQVQESQTYNLVPIKVSEAAWFIIKLVLDLKSLDRVVIRFDHSHRSFNKLPCTMEGVPQPKYWQRLGWCHPCGWGLLVYFSSSVGHFLVYVESFHLVLEQ